MGATPVALVDYIGIDVAEEEFLVQFASALADAALEAGVAVVGGEIAQIGEMLNPSHGTPRFDLIATAVGLCRLVGRSSGGEWPKALDRKNVKVRDSLFLFQAPDFTATAIVWLGEYCYLKLAFRSIPRQ